MATDNESSVTQESNDAPRPAERATTGTIYIVTEGEYSDYRIVGVFSDKAVADDHCAAYNSTERLYSRGDRSVEEWTIDGMVPPGRGLLRFTVTASLDGWNHVTEASPDDADELSPTSTDGTHWRQAVWARNEDHAEKIVRDNIARAKAEEAGIE